MLLIEQNLGMATAIAERQLVMVAGTIAAETTAAELTSRHGAPAPLPRRRAAGRDAVTYDGGRPHRHARHEGRRVRLPSRPPGRPRGRGDVVDAGVHEPFGLSPDVGRAEVARAAGADVEQLAARGDRGAAVEAMGAGAELGRLAAVRARAGSTASSRSAAPGARRSRRARCAPCRSGVPKLMVSTVASGDTRPYVGAVDVTMMYSVVDISGVNTRLGPDHGQRGGSDRGHGRSAQVPAARARGRSSPRRCSASRPPCVTRARERLEELGYEVLVFHATGDGRAVDGGARRRAASSRACST